ncbi:PssE/Cps14G family polysaccharide biosynthesis glycosyltransferase [Vibrio diabolicus]|uniref:PssE/Cps14G family polysaccharide biosynthesis glycosyltransferase n=1 Tax=Vibrio diabolicus TaxID=50719 RepID=UPI00215ECBE5|nr:PssE/Cps14G family polysaccharide biosynthesis glycosyltransferase [Vibrio diabolicus]MCS0305990.1 hypothetical protein [Vibrio diabolicus]MCS0404661.1 hypothetical protein [Vibrio diabolicus]
MSRFFYTVGTTPFPSLTAYLVDNFDVPGNEVFLQTAQSTNTQYIESVSFISDFEEKIEDYELIVTHAGAGSVYGLLEKGKNLIVVPNLERDDKHQIEIAKFVEENMYAIVCWDFLKLPELIESYKTFEKSEYRKDRFFKDKEIIGFFK